MTEWREVRGGAKSEEAGPVLAWEMVEMVEVDLDNGEHSHWQVGPYSCRYLGDAERIAQLNLLEAKAALGQEIFDCYGDPRAPSQSPWIDDWLTRWQKLGEANG